MGKKSKVSNRPFHNEEIEQVLLEACLRDSEAGGENIPLIFDQLKTEDFYSPRHQVIFESVRSLWERKAPIDYLSLSNELKTIRGWEISSTELKEILFDHYFLGMDLDFYINQLKIHSQRRALQTFLEKSLERIQDPSVEFPELEEEVSRGMIQILSGQRPPETMLLKPMESFFPEIKDLFKNNRSMHTGIQTGWTEFDRFLGGIRQGELTVLTGETASGKTTFAMNLSYRLAKKGHSVLIASFEMKPIAVVRKMLQSESGQPISSHTIESIFPYFRNLSSFPIFFVDAYGEMGLPQLKRLVRYAKKICAIEFLVLDHLHFFLKYSTDQERQAIDQALRDIKSWAMDLGIHVILIVHPTKLTYDNKVVHLNDLKGSSGLKQIPDNVLSIWRPRTESDLKKPQNEIVLYILKVRDDEGNEGKVILTFDKRGQSYSDGGPGLTKRSWHDEYDQ